MIRKEYPISLKKGQHLYLWTLGDVGFAGKRCDQTRLESDLRWHLEKKKQGHLVKIIGEGDWLAFPSPSDRAAIVAAKQGNGFYKGSVVSTLDEEFLRKCDKFISFLSPFHNDVLGNVHGHHYYDFSPESDYRGINSDEYICKKLGADYYGDIGQVQLRFPGVTPGNGNTFLMIVHHGYGGGRTKGHVIAKRDRVFRGFAGNAVLFGHDNARMADCSNIMHWGGIFEQRSIATGSYEKAYRVGETHNGYVEEGLMNPSAIGATTILFEIWDNQLRVRAMI